MIKIHFTSKKIKLEMIFIISFLLTQCTTYYYTSSNQYHPEKLIDIPTPKHTNEVELYLSGEKPKDTSFYKIEIVEVHGKEQVSYTMMINAMKKVAQDHGLDAVIIIDKDSYTSLKRESGDLILALTNPRSWLALRDYYTTNTTSLYSIGIKYTKNINYLNQYPVAKQVFYFDPQTKQEKEIINIQLDSYGREKKRIVKDEKGARDFKKEVDVYDYNYLVYSVGKNWYEAYDNQNHVIKRKHMTETGETDLKVKLKYDEQNRVNEIKMVRPGYEMQKRIQLTYVNNKIITKEIFHRKKLLEKQVFVYDEKNKLIEEKIYSIQDQSEILSFRVVYSYCEFNAISCFLNRE